MCFFKKDQILNFFLIIFLIVFRFDSSLERWNIEIFFLCFFYFFRKNDVTKLCLLKRWWICEVAWIISLMIKRLWLQNTWIRIWQKFAKSLRSSENDVEKLRWSLKKFWSFFFKRNHLNLAFRVHSEQCVSHIVINYVKNEKLINNY